MKTRKVEKRLVLRKNTVANLGDSEADQVKGGAPETALALTCASLVETCQTCTCFNTAIMCTCTTSILWLC